MPWGVREMVVIESLRENDQEEMNSDGVGWLNNLEMISKPQLVHARYHRTTSSLAPAQQHSKS